MPGANHEMESEFLNSLHQDDRGAAVEILHNHYLKELIYFYENAVSEDLNRKFNKTPKQWHNIIKKVLLTKLSYFTPSPNLSAEHIEFIVRITSNIFQQPDQDLMKIHKKLQNSHTFFANWLKEIDANRLKYAKN